MEKGFFLRYDEFNSNPEANLVAGLCGYDVGYGCDRQKFIFRILVEMNRIPTNLQLNRVEGMGMAWCAVVDFHDHGREFEGTNLQGASPLRTP